MKKKKSIDSKVVKLFKNLAGENASILKPNVFPYLVRDKIAKVLKKEYGEKKAYDIAFHLVDWNSNAAFMVALYLFPEKFSKKEIEEGVMNLIFHAPDHIAAAAKLYGHPIEDTFEVGVFDNEETE